MASKSNPPTATGVRAGKPGPHLTPTSVPKIQPAPPVPQEAGLVAGWCRFWFTPASALGLHVVRVFSGLLFLFWLLPFAGHVDAFFGAQGWFDLQAYQEAARAEQARRTAVPGSEQAQNIPQTPPIGWSLLFLFWNDSGTLHAFYWASLLVLLLFTLGLWTRITAVLTWLIIVSFLPNPIFRYDADYLLAILALYLMIGYVLQGLWSRKLSVAERILGPSDNFLLHRWLKRRAGTEEPAESYAANLAIRFVQIHFALIMVVSGLHKLQFGPYWGGWALFYPLHSPFDYTFESMRAQVGSLTTDLVVLSLAQYLWLAWQIGFPGFAWRKGLWRVVLIGGGVVAWLGSFFIFQAPLFGPFCLIGCLSYLTAEEWRRVGAWLGGMVGDWARPATEAKVRVGT